MSAAIDEISGGRFVLGLGAGWNEAEFRAFGVPFDNKVTRFEESFEIIRRLLAGQRVTFEGQYHRVDHAVLLPKPARRVPIMVGSAGPRMVEITCEHVETWNSWYSWYGNTPEGFAVLSAKLGINVRRSACVLVAVEGGAGERPAEAGSPPIEASRLPEHLRALAEAGAHEAILVLDPITESSVRTVAAIAATS
jgi:alkanesulfonate monooxygenase SsuD/methylene tetrahydromethanopterin reductase-like flavin-dependent oxidoreductase (luciferase family)